MHSKIHRSFSNSGGSPLVSVLGALNLVEHWPGVQRLHPRQTHCLLPAHPYRPHPQGPPSLLWSKGAGAADGEGPARAAACEPCMEQREASPTGPRCSLGEKSRCLCWCFSLKDTSLPATKLWKTDKPWLGVLKSQRSVAFGPLSLWLIIFLHWTTLWDNQFLFCG